MSVNKHKYKLIILMIGISFLFMGQTNLRWKALMFDNPGTKRILKSEKSNVFYYRSLPEKGMILNVKDMQAIEIRAIAKSKVNKSQFILKYNDKKTTYDLKFFSASLDYQIYEPVRITLVPGLKQVELICYDRNIYFRAFQPITIQKKTKVPSLKIIKHSGAITLNSATSKKQYYTFKQDNPFSFQINKNKTFSLFIRAELKAKKAAVFGVYRNGELIDKISLSMKRTKAYTAEGINHLTIGKKMEYPAMDKIAVYELRALTDNLFIVRPVIKKAK